jgi:hypothetical protein
MEFMRRHGIGRLQVLVMNPNLIPQMVNIVIGDSLYELKFRVEMGVEAGEPHPMDTDDNHPMDTDDNHGAGGSGQKEEEGSNNNAKNLMKGSKMGSGETATGGGTLKQGAGQSASKIVPLFIIQAPSGVQEGDGSLMPAGVLEGD